MAPAPGTERAPRPPARAPVQDGDWHDTLFIPPRQGALKATPELFNNISNDIGVSDQMNDMFYCMGQTGPDGQTPGRFEDGASP